MTVILFKNIRKAMRHILGASLFLFFTTACFTGIESTPKIGQGEVKRETSNAAVAEAEYIADIVPQPFNLWQPGKEFVVTDPKINRIFTPVVNEAEFSQGDILIYQGATDVTSPYGEAVDILFTDSDKREFTYRINAGRRELNTRAVVDIPFTTENDVLQKLRERLIGNDFYILTPRWVDAGGNFVTRIKFIPVTVTDVSSGSAEMPVIVLFHPRYQDVFNGTETFGVPLNIGGTANSTRSFSSLFSLSNPRIRHKSITDANWALIVENKLAPGMTRDEARLALGAPVDVDRGHDYSSVYEKWIYDGGVYLIFRDGLLESYRR